jgi:type I restriction enzyme S subunit
MAYGASEPSEFAVPSHPRFIRITDIDDDGSLRDDTFRSLEPDVATPYLLRRGDLLFARSGATVGKTLLFAGEDGSACFAGYLIRFRANTERVLPSFVYAVTQSAYYWWCIREGSIQATIQNFSAEKYGDIVIAVPPLKEQCAIVEHIARETAKLDAVRAATERTIALLRSVESRLSLPR